MSLSFSDYKDVAPAVAPGVQQKGGSALQSSTYKGGVAHPTPIKGGRHRRGGSAHAVKTLGGRRRRSASKSKKSRRSRSRRH